MNTNLGLIIITTISVIIGIDARIDVVTVICCFSFIRCWESLKYENRSSIVTIFTVSAAGVRCLFFRKEILIGMV